MGVFQPLKHYHAEAIDDHVRKGDENYERLDFLAKFSQFWAKAMKPSIIKSAWQKCGLISFNPETVLKKIRSKNPHNAITSPSSSPEPIPKATISLPNTPKEPGDVKAVGESLSRRI